MINMKVCFPIYIYGDSESQDCLKKTYLVCNMEWYFQAHWQQIQLRWGTGPGRKDTQFRQRLPPKR